MDGKAEYTPFKYARDFKNEAFVQKVVRIESWSKMPISSLKKESKDELFSTCEWCIDVQSPTLITSVCTVIARLNLKKTNEFLANLLCRVDVAENAKTFIILLACKKRLRQNQRRGFRRFVYAAQILQSRIRRRRRQIFRGVRIRFQQNRSACRG